MLLFSALIHGAVRQEHHSGVKSTARAECWVCHLRHFARAERRPSGPHLCDQVKTPSAAVRRNLRVNGTVRGECTGQTHYEYSSVVTHFNVTHLCVCVCVCERERERERERESERERRERQRGRQRERERDRQTETERETEREREFLIDLSFTRAKNASDMRVCGEK